ncbi:hypothetical protein ACER0C_002867 [Sarotherodon galilaeus]
MKMFVVFVILLHVSQHALAVLVQVYEEAKVALLPCRFSGFIPDQPTVMWTRSDLDPKTVHMRLEGGDDLTGQNQHYSGRTSIMVDALNTGDFSLTLRKPQRTDVCNYTCTMSDGTGEQRLTDVQLQVKGDSGGRVTVCPPALLNNIWAAKDIALEWTCAVIVVYVYPYRKQDGLYRDRMKMNKDLLRTGDLSLTLKYPTERDSGGYICTIYRDKDILRQKVVLQNNFHPGPNLSWFFWFFLWFLEVFYFISGTISCQTPRWSLSSCPKTKVHLPEDVKVVWSNSYNKNVHVYEKGSNQPGEQEVVYRDRTEMNEDLLKTGDLSLTLKHPTDGNTGAYTCTVYSREGNILLRRKVELKVRDCQVEVEEGVESVQLPFKTTQNLPEDARVEWEYCEPECRKIHLYHSGSDHLEEQDQDYRDRTKMNEDPLKTGDLSLTLKHPKKRDSGRYRCEVKRGVVLLGRKRLLLKVRVQVQDQTGDIRNRSSSIDSTSLMADQSNCALLEISDVVPGICWSHSPSLGVTTPSAPTTTETTVTFTLHILSSSSLSPWFD